MEGKGRDWRKGKAGEGRGRKGGKGKGGDKSPAWSSQNLGSTELAQISRLRSASVCLVDG